MFGKLTLRLRYALMVLLVCVGPLVLPTTGQAAGSPDRLTQLTVSLWFEYDRPGVLCIYRGELPEGTPLPARVSFRLPTQPSSTAGIDEQGRYRYLRPTVILDGGTYLVSYDIAWSRFQLEYYDDSLRKQGTGRELDYVYRADYPVEHLVLEVKEPAQASDFRLEPEADTQSQADDSLIEHRRTVGPVKPGQEVRWRISYIKTDPRLASEALGLPTPVPTAFEQAPMGRSRLPMSWLLLGLMGLGALVAVGGLALAWRQGGEPAAPGPAWARATAALSGAWDRRGRKGRARAGGVQRRLAAYCHECGAAMNREDTFCRKCGTRRRGV